MDAVVIATPINIFAKVAKIIIENDIRVLIEKLLLQILKMSMKYYNYHNQREL